MKKQPFKAVWSLTFLLFLLSVVAPNDLFAQQNNRKAKAKKVKVVTPVKQYKKYPRRGAQVTSLPRKTVVVPYKRSNYHYRDGIFYRPVNGSYIVASPPIGIRISVLPPNPYRVFLRGQTYYYHYGTYYVPVHGGGFEVVDAPVGARIDALPDGYEIFELDGRVYYRLDQCYYKAVVESNGNVVYEVVRV